MQMTVTKFLLLVALATAPTFGFPTDPSDTSEGNYLDELVSVNDTTISWPSVMYFPDDNGEPMAAVMEACNETSSEFVSKFPHSSEESEDECPMPDVQESDVFFKLYTRQGPTEGEILIPGDVSSLKNSHFNASEPTFFITHGFLQSIEAKTIQSIKDMYIAYVGGNVIAVDWSKISKSPFYPSVKGQTMQVGQFIGAFTAFLVREAGLNVKHVHLIGHSLGAHVVGIAGKSIRLTVGHKPGRITGLDPAGPQYSVKDKAHRLDKEDADFVDVIHTCGGWLGMSAAIGHADYYPNGGRMRQPGCSFDFVMAGTCSHSRSWELFAESISTRGFSARHCTSYREYLHEKCGDDHPASMGYHSHNSETGTFYLKTAKFSPYALG